MKRVVIVVVWTFVFWVLSAILFGVGALFVVKGNDIEKNKAIVSAEARKWNGTMFLGALTTAFSLSAWRILPGTRRRPAPPLPPADHDYPTPRPTVAVPVGLPEDPPPPEIAALGPAHRVHERSSLASLSWLGRLVVLVLGLVLFFAPFAIVNAVGHDAIPKSARTALLGGGVVAGLVCLVIAVFPKSPYSYQIHRDALVVSDGKMQRIIPWEQIEALIPWIPLFRDVTVLTRDGVRVPITSSVRDSKKLLSALLVMVRGHLLPRMIARAQAGRMVEFGKFAVSSYEVRYKGETISWNDVKKMVIITGEGYRHLTVYRYGLLSFWPFCMMNLNLVPNDWILLDLLKEIAPPRLLVKVERRWGAAR